MNGNSRKTGKEQYYTLPSVAKTCVRIAMKYYQNETIIEPAGGTGEFINALLQHNIPVDKIISTDIEPKHSLVKQADYLETAYDIDFENLYFTISNPPFGRANSLSVKFFNHAAIYSSHICFLIPISWRKWTVIDKLDKRFDLVEDVEMPGVSFYNEDGTIEGSILKTCFQVWQRKGLPRKPIIKSIEDRGYLWRTTPEDADVALVMLGHSSGRVETDFERVPNSTKGYFAVRDSTIIDALRSVDYTKYNQNVAYTQSLGFDEVKQLLNDYFDENS